MSTLKVNKLRDTAGSADAITLDPNGGAVLAGVTTMTTARVTSGIVTNTFIVGAGVTISESGIEASGIGITCANINGTQIGGRRNKFLNGAMTVSQRGSSFTSDGYTLDRFERQQSSDGAFTVTQSTTSPDGFSNSLKVDVTTADTSLAASQYAQIKYKIEAQDLQDLAFGTSAAKTVTLSFYVRSNKTGNYAFAIQQSDNSFKMSSFQYAISSADTWERKTITIAGDTSGVINNDTGDGFILLWALAAGTDLTSGSLRSTFTTRVAADQYAGQGVNLLDSTSNEWYLTGVQLEVGSQATSFEHRSFGEELSLCSRYYQKIAEGTNKAVAFCFNYNNQYADWVLQYPMGPMRSSPSLDQVNGADYYRYHGGDTVDCHLDGAFLIEQQQITQANIYFDVDEGLTAGRVGYVKTDNAAAYLAISSEL